MFVFSRKLARSLAAVAGLAMAAPLGALAQLAPTGEHYAARASDTGFGGGVGASGGYGTSVPLDLPGARGGLAVPVRLVYGGHQFGAAGIGWDVPLAFIRRDLTVAHRRPANSPNTSPQPREQLSLTLGGAGTDLVRNADDDKWFSARRNDAQLTAHDAGDGVHFDVYDGNGRRYSFTSDPAGTGRRLDNGNFYVLSDIFGSGNTHVHLDYTVGNPTLAGGVTGLSIDLASASYNYDSTGSCAKHQVDLVYDNNASSPLSLQMLGGTPLVSLHKLQAIDVKARETAAGSSQPCSGPMRSLRTYNLEYQNDVDTGQFQLHRVTMIGQETKPERNLTLPVATYSYGEVTSASGALIYGDGGGQTISLPAAAAVIGSGFAIASTLTSTVVNPDGSGANTAKSFQNLLDVNGDGRPDFLPFVGSFDLFTMGAALNKPDPADPTKAIFTPINVPDRDPNSHLESLHVPNQFDEAQTTTFPRRTDIDGNRNDAQRWTQIIDVNGDGRVDVLAAHEVLNAWVVYLNTPDRDDPNRIAWVRREIDIRPLLNYLPTNPSNLVQTPNGVFLALSSTVTGHDQAFNLCWQRSDESSTDWSEVPPHPGACSPITAAIDVSDKTITQWELRDVNGDGYPDLLFNASAVGQLNPPHVAPQNSETTGLFAPTTLIKPFDFLGASEVKALLNVAGVHLDTGSDISIDAFTRALRTGTSAFSAPITLDVGCGVTRWSSTDGRNATVEECGFEDVNGDGMLDRLANVTTARLGTGVPAAPFSNAFINLPGPAARSQSDLAAIDDGLGHFRPAACPATDQQSNFPFSNVTYAIRRTHGFSDLNGDGIPDYIAYDSRTNSWTAALGTGAGFAAPKALFSGQRSFELSLEQVGCFADNTSGGTIAGLYDFYGDGSSAFVSLGSGGDGDPHLNVYRLNESPDGATLPTSGLLTRIDNGYGASTDITYRSAKEDLSTNHLVPRPELVVTKVSTQDVFGPSLSPTLYAYGEARQHFDSASDRWVFPGYRRRVSLQNTGDPNDSGAGNAVISDALALDPFNLHVSVDPTARFLRYLKAGRASDVTNISGELGIDPWALLTTNIKTDARRMAATHIDYSGQLLPVGKTGNEYCIDMLDPYDYSGSAEYDRDRQGNHQSFDQCAERGFSLQTSVISYRGTPGTATGTADVIASPQIVQTASSVTAFDDLGRVTDRTNKGDLTDNLANAAVKDDLCVHVDYARPLDQTSPVRVLNAVAQRTVTSCGDGAPVLARQRFEYDGYATSAENPVGQVSNGFVTSSTVTRYDSDTLLSRGDIRLFDATFDANGNPLTIAKTRDDGARNITNFNQYDPFGFVTTSVTSWAFDGVTWQEPLSSSVTPDAVTLNVTSVTDTNGTVTGTAYDGFGRVTRSRVTLPDGSERVLSTTSYSGFELVDTDGDGIPDTSSALTTGLGRSVVQKVFQDAVLEKDAATTPGRSATVFLDSLGRTTKSDVQLGADYQNQTLVVGRRTYDPLGRVKFVLDPDTIARQGNGYGTTYNYNTDGTPSCFVRGPGIRSASAVVDEANEIYPTCFNRSFANNQEVATVQTADSLSPSPDSFTQALYGTQSGVVSTAIRNATGRILETQTKSAGGTILKDVAYGYDALGHQTTMTRYKDPINKTGPATVRRHYDSLGWMTGLEEFGVDPQTPSVAPQTRIFDSWGNISAVQWCDNRSAGSCPGQERSTVTRFDGRNRMTHREDRMAGQTVAETVADFTYDQNSTVLGIVGPNKPLGRLASATWPKGQEWFHYDMFGRLDARSFIDTSVASNDHHYEIHERHHDGSEKTLHLLMSDNNDQDEQINYKYDSVGRVNSVVYSFGGASQTLFSASGNSPIYDTFGRTTDSLYGPAQFQATYAASGRRLLTDVKVTSGDHAHSREISYPTLSILAPTVAFDAVGRERHRREFVDGSGSVAQVRNYDVLGQLAGTETSQAPHVFELDRTFAYDGLGNILTQNDATSGHPGSVSLSYGGGTADPDRICAVIYGGGTAPQSPCNLTYDGAGNTLSMPTRTGTRTLYYFPSGAVKRIDGDGSRADFAYDAFGGLQQLTVDTLSADRRADKYFGGFIKQRIEGAQSVINRRIPVPGGVATLHGASTGKWTFAFGEPRGTRFVTDQAGKFAQGIDYQPFGEVRNPTDATAGMTNYENQQFNGGDLLAAFGVVNLGARVYDPVVGRFLSRDAVIGGNPYGFANNDPINRIDPTGLFPASVGGPGGGETGILLHPPAYMDPFPAATAYTDSLPMGGAPSTGGMDADWQQYDASEPYGVADDPIKAGFANPGNVLALASPASGPPRVIRWGGRDIQLSDSPAWRALQLDAARNNYPLPISPERAFLQAPAKILNRIAHSIGGFITWFSGAEDGICDGNGNCAGGLGRGSVEPYVSGGVKGAIIVGTVLVPVLGAADGAAALAEGITLIPTESGGVILSIGSVYDATLYQAIGRTVAQGEIFVDGHGLAIAGRLTGLPAETTVEAVQSAVTYAQGYLRTQGIVANQVTLSVCGSSCVGGLAEAVRASSGLPTIGSRGVTSVLETLGRDGVTYH